MNTKTSNGNFFEDFKFGQSIQHAIPRTITDGDVSLFIALSGARYAQFSSRKFAFDIGFELAPVDNILVFNMIFGKSVAEISTNAIANLGYAEGKFMRPVKVGDTILARSEIIGIKENSDGKAGIVYVKTTGYNQFDKAVLSYCHWVMLKKRNAASPAPYAEIPNLEKVVAADELTAPCELKRGAWDCDLSGSYYGFEDYEIGEKINHHCGMTIEEAEHMLATRLFQNPANLHFDANAQKDSRFGQRLIYGGVIIAYARALAFKGFENAGNVIAVNGGYYANPLFAGDTIYAWSEVLDKAIIGNGWGALRLLLVVTKGLPCDDFPYKNNHGKYLPEIVFDFDYWAAIPLRSSLQINI